MSSGGMICLKSVASRVINERSVRRVDGNVWRNCYVMKRGTVWFVLSTWSQGEVSYRLPVSSGGREHTHERKDGWWRAERRFEETPLLREAALEKKSIPSLQRKKFMKLEHKRSHVQLAARNLRGEAGEEVGGDEVIKTSEEANKACRWSMILASRYSHSSLGRCPLRSGYAVLEGSSCLPSTNQASIYGHT